MNKIIINLIFGITIITHMWAFPVHAAEDLVRDAQTLVENQHNEEMLEETGEETVFDNDIEAVLENETTDEVASSEKTEENAGIGAAIEEELTVESAAGEPTDGESDRTEAATEDELAAKSAAEEPTDGKSEETGAAVQEELTAEDAAEEVTDGEREEMEEDHPEDDSDGVTEVTPDAEYHSDDVTVVTPGDSADLPEPQIPAADAGADEEPEDSGTSAPAMMYTRPVISSISTDGTSITLEWDNAEGALFQIYRWNIFPYVIGTSTTGSFVDTDVVSGRSYTYFIATTSSVYLYPYSQSVSLRVRLPIEDIDEGHKFGDDFVWSPAEGDEGGNSLIISGNGRMPDFSSPSETPWHDSAGEIKHISIDEGVTYVGDHTFSDMEALQEISMPSSVREYGHDVFHGSTNLEFFNHDSAVDGEQLHIAVQYLMGVYSGDSFGPEVYVRKGVDIEGFDGMPELVRGRDYTVTYINTTEVGDGTIEITFIGDYSDAGSVVIPFTVVSELGKDEKGKTITGIELLPASSTYNGTAQHPDMIVRSGRWILKEGVDYELINTDMIDVGTYTVTAQGIGAYSGTVQAVYTILEQEQSEGPIPPVNPSKPSDDPSKSPVNPSKPSDDPSKSPANPSKSSDDPSKSPANPSVPAKNPVSDVDEITSQKTEERAEFNEEKADTEGETEAVTQSEKEMAAEAAAEPKNEEATKALAELEKIFDSFPAVFENSLGSDLSGKGVFSLGSNLVENSSKPVKFFVGAVGIVASICIGVYFWFFHWFRHGL